MKHKFLIALMIVTGCVQHSSTAIEGMYVRESAGEFSRAYDTLIIYECDKKTRSCLVRRKTGFMRIREGVVQPKEWHSEKMITDYDEDTGELIDRKSGRVFFFKDGKLLFGTAEYGKVNQ